MTPTHSRSAADMRRLLPAAGRLLGVHIYVTDGTDWAFDDDTVTVGEDFFTRDGHSVREAEALTLVTLWRLIRLPRIEPVMVLRRSRLGAQLPEVEPLLNAIDICIASARTARAFPAASPWISAAFTRRLDANMLDAEPTELPKHAQFVSCLIDHICGSSQMRFSPEIHAALENQPHDAPPT